jgi:hypothetical protein
LDGPFVVLFQQQGSDEPCDRSFVWKYSDNVAAPFNFAVQTLERVGAVQLGPVLRRKFHIGQHVGFGIIHQGGEFADARPQLIGDLAPLFAGVGGIVLRECGADSGRHDASLRLAGMGHGVAHEVHAAALPGGAEHPRDGGFEALMGVKSLAILTP